MTLHHMLSNLEPLPDAATIAEAERIHREAFCARCVATMSEAVAEKLAEAWRHTYQWERAGGVRVQRRREVYYEEDIAADVCAAIQAALPHGFVVSVASADNTSFTFELTYRRAE